MSLNIKDDQAHKLANELAALTGETMTRVVTVALSERLERIRKIKRKATVEEMVQIGQRCAAQINAPVSSLDHGDFLYGERGLPR